MWGCGLSPHPHIYPSILLAGGFFSALSYGFTLGATKNSRAAKFETTNPHDIDLHPHPHLW